MRRRAGRERAGQDRAHLLVRPDDAGACRVAELDAVAAGVVGAAAAAPSGELGRKRGARVRPWRHGEHGQTAGAVQKVHVAVAVAYGRECVRGADGVDEKPRSVMPSGRLMEKSAWLPRMRVRESTNSVLVAKCVHPFFCRLNLLRAHFLFEGFYVLPGLHYSL